MAVFFDEIAFWCELALWRSPFWYWENFTARTQTQGRRFCLLVLIKLRHHPLVLIDQSAWPSAWWMVEHWWNSKNNGLQTGALFCSSPRLALCARVEHRAKHRIRPAWLIKRLSCRLEPSSPVYRGSHKRLSTTPNTCPIYMKWVGSSIVVDDRMSRSEIQKGSKLYFRKSNCLVQLYLSRRIVTTRHFKKYWPDSWKCQVVIER